MEQIKRGRPASIRLRKGETARQRVLARERWLHYYYSLTPQEAWIRATIGNSKRRAKNLGLLHSITADHVRNLIPADLLCPILGIPLDIRKRKGVMTIHSATLDRIDPKGHYTPDNVQVISNLANRGKCHMDLVQLTKLGQWAARVLGEAENEADVSRSATSGRTQHASKVLKSKHK